MYIQKDLSEFQLALLYADDYVIFFLTDCELPPTFPPTPRDGREKQGVRVSTPPVVLFDPDSITPSPKVFQVGFKQAL